MVQTGRAEAIAHDYKIVRYVRLSALMPPATVLMLATSPVAAIVRDGRGGIGRYDISRSLAVPNGLVKVALRSFVCRGDNIKVLSDGR